ncbi:MAG TPA: DUF4139 domain-containing protein [Burkholderiales bacterium]|nr:DUF4139 domain-containing protein [Burkholderiales bacterium]
MKKRIVGGVVFLCVLSGAAHARVTAVVLYPGSATVERAGQVGPGNGRLEMAGLPAGFDVRTLRVDADPGVRIGAVAVRDAGRAEAMSAREAQLEAQILALRDAVAALEGEVKSAELVRDYLASLTARPSGGKPLVVEPGAIAGVVEAMRGGAGDSYRIIHQARIKKRGIEKDLAALERDLARLKSGARDVRTLTVSYSASRAGEVRASYQVPNAGWKPVYRAALDSSASRVELERQALVTQRTGEDWNGVRLRLSTGRPSPTQVVDPQPWQLVVRPPAVPAARAVAREMRDAAAPAKAEQLQGSEQLQTPYATEFEVPGSVDLVSDGRQVTVSLARESVPVQQRIRVVPRRDTGAMVTAEAALPEGVWIPGDLQLYRDGSYIGSTFWQPQAKERLVLPFGRDDRVQVAVHRTQNRSGTGGIIGQRAEREIADLYTVTSRHKLPVELLVLEAAPVAVSDDISVEAAFEPQPKVRDWERRRGVVAWEQSLAPGETLKFAAGYTISYPKDAPVIGLP